MTHIHTKPNDHDLTVSAYIINVEDPEQPKLLLHKHKTLRKLMQPGGHVELDETPWEAMAREILEETGYGLIHLTLLQVPGALNIKLPNPSIRVQPSPVFINTHAMDNGMTSHYHNDMSYAFLTDAKPRFPVRKGESQDFKLVTLEELASFTREEINSTAQTVGKAVLEAYNAGGLIPTEKPYRT